MIRQLGRSVCVRNYPLGFGARCPLRRPSESGCPVSYAPQLMPARCTPGSFVRNLSSSSPKRRGESSLQSKIAQKWQQFLEPKVMPQRYTAAWYREVLLICTVFAVTGSSTMVLVRPAVSKGLGIQGSLKDGPWSYRICSLVIMSPIYSVLLLAVGTVFGRHAYFRHFSARMLSRFGIPPEMVDKTFHETKTTFRKW